MVVFVHAADLHLDSPLRGLDDYESAPAERLRLASRRALENLVDLCLEKDAQFLLIAGDLFDQDSRDFNTALFVARQMRRLAQRRVRAFIILGNHDSHQEMTRSIPWPDNVHVFSHQAPETIQISDLGVAVHGMSFARRSVSENLVPEYPEPVPGMFNIGILHTSAGLDCDHSTYAPCTVTDLRSKGYQYWALGHVHSHRVLSEEPHVVFSGTTQGRHAKETGAKGAVAVSVEGRSVTECRFHPLDVVRWRQVTAELRPDDGVDDAIAAVADQLSREHEEADGRLLAARVILTGRCRAHRALTSPFGRDQWLADLRSRLQDVSEDIWLEKVHVRTRPPVDIDRLRDGHDLVGEVLRDLADRRSDPARLLELAEPLAPLLDKVGSEILKEGVDLGEPEARAARLAEWLAEAETILVDLLTEEQA